MSVEAPDPATEVLTDAPPVTAHRYEVLVNTHAGAVLEVGGAVLKRRLEAAFAAVDAPAVVHLGAVPALHARLLELNDPATVPVLVGGDGTVLALMSAILDRGLPFALLPMGTMNLLGRDLGLVGDIEVDVRALHTGRTRRVDLATLNGTPFHSTSGLGFAAIVARERERARLRIPFSLVLATAVAAVRALLRTQPVEVDVEVDGRVERRVADAVLVTNNLFQGSPWRRPRLDEGILEIHLLNAPGFWARSRAALAVMTGEWRALRHLMSFRAPTVTLRQPGRRRIRVTLDGEVTLQESVLSYAIVPGALEILAADPDVTVRQGRVMSNERAVGI